MAGRGSIRCSRSLPRSRWPPEASPPCACFPWPPGWRTGWPPGAGGSPPRWPPGSSAGCQCARASAALLLTMAVATGTLALAQHASWLRSASDQAAFATGGDVQVDPPAPLDPGDAGAVTAARGVTHAMAVAAQNPGGPGEVIALDAAQAAPVVRLRADESPLPPGSLFRAITPSGGLPGAVLPVPSPVRDPAPSSSRPRSARPRRRPAGKLAAELGPVTVTLTILDRTGAAYQVPPGHWSRTGARTCSSHPSAAKRHCTHCGWPRSRPRSSCRCTPARPWRSP